MTATAVRLRADVAINVAYEDRTPFGAPHGHGPERTARMLFAPLVERLQRGCDLREILTSQSLVLAEVRERQPWSAVTRPHADGWELRDEVLFPDPVLTRARVLKLARIGTRHAVRAQIPDGYWPAVHELVSHLSTDWLTADAAQRLHPNLATLVQRLNDEHLLQRADGPDVDAEAAPITRMPGYLFLGHNSVQVSSVRTSVMVDPFVFAHSAENPSGYQPIQLRDLNPVPDAIAITHSHPDHFDPASLLRFPPSTVVIVPWIARETLLSVDLARRLRELGFTDIRPLRWHDTTTVGDIRVTAYPFYGEQPTDGSWLHPEVRNNGCTYRIDTPSSSAVFLADSGSDHLGSALELATSARRADGPVDTVFCGYRGWLSYPVQLLPSSVGRYFLLVPPDLWRSRMTLMATADMAIDITERWGATRLCAYGDGGAPWHWRIGLGPQLDGARREMTGFDPFPETVLAAAASRSVDHTDRAVASPIDVEILHPGEQLHIPDQSGPGQLVQHDGHRWPY